MSTSLLYQARLRALVRALVVVGFVFCISGLTSVFWMMYLDTAPPFVNKTVYTTNEAGIKQDVFRAGDVMFVHRDFCVTRETPITFGRSLVRLSDRLNVNINATTDMLRMGCVSGPNALRIPPETPPGEYEFRNVVQFSNNPFQSGAVTLLAPRITVLP